MRTALFIKLSFILVLILVLFGNPAFAEDTPKMDSRCTVCGMFVAKYPSWVTTLKRPTGKILFFDGVKDMMVYLFNPDKYGGVDADKNGEVWVKDYYSLNPFNARNAYFVVGSDVYGPMGHEFIPFSSKEAAESFKKDHHGQKIIKFEQITSKQVEDMRSGHRMK